MTAEIEVNGHGKIVHKINGESVIEYEQAQLDPGDNDARALMKNDDVEIGEGYICLQAESHPIEFRKVEILPLKP